VAEFETDEKDVTRKDGEIYDTMPNYIWTNYVGGDFDGQDVVGRDLEKKVVKFGDEEGCTYSRRVHVLGGFRLIAYVDVHHPRHLFWPYEVMRAMVKTHPNLMKTTYRETIKQ
jgi:hypothetical protein